jgi:hypothetical protein
MRDLHVGKFARAADDDAPFTLLRRLVGIDFGDRSGQRGIRAEVLGDERERAVAVKLADDNGGRVRGMVGWWYGCSRKAVA